MTTSVDFTPDYATPPGETIAELLAESDMTQTELAQRLGVSLKHVHQVVRGAATVSPDLAMGLERVLGSSAEYWVTREAHYQADRARLEDYAELAEYEEWANSFPVQELRSRGYIAKAKDAAGPGLVRELLSFFAVASPQQYKPVSVPFRKSLKVQSDSEALSAWVRAGEVKAAALKCEPFDADGFRDALHEIRSLTLVEAEEWAPRLVEICAGVGVAVVVVPVFKKARANGAAQWLSPTKALIQLSLRYRWEDIFWFSFFHEAGHILLHRKKDIFLDDGKEAGSIEDEANRFASRMLIPAQYERKLSQLNVHDVEAFARQVGIAPGCVVGRLQHDGYLTHSVGNSLRKKLPNWLGENA